MEDPLPILIKTETDSNAIEIDSDFKIIKSKVNLEHPDKTSQDNFICSICRKDYTDQKRFFDHLETHYLPESAEHFQCLLCQETFTAQVDFYIHVRNHYKPSLISELGTSITGACQNFLTSIDRFITWL